MHPASGRTPSQPPAEDDHQPPVGEPDQLLAATDDAAAVGPPLGLAELAAEGRIGQTIAEIHVTCTRGAMGVFLDGHTYLEVPVEALRRALRAAESIQAAAGEAHPIDYIVTGGWIYCVIEAPDPPAVERLHAALGLPHPKVVPVHGAEARRPLSQHDRELILKLIG